MMININSPDRLLHEQNVPAHLPELSNWMDVYVNVSFSTFYCLFYIIRTDLWGLQEIQHRCFISERVTAQF